MKLRTFLLDEWLERYEGHGEKIRYNLAASTGPGWTLDGLRRLMTAQENERLLKTSLSYQPGHGTESLRRELAALYRAKADEIQVLTGAAEGLLVLFFLAAEPGANVVVPYPAFPPFLSIPESFGLEVRRYELDARNGFALHLDRVASLVDDRTKLVLVNSPHNPTGSVISESDIGALEELTAKRGAQLVVDEVYHPIYRGRAPRSAGEYTRATILGDFSKAFSLSGIRAGWILERDPKRREEYWNARAHFSISNNFPGELLAEVAVRNRETIFNRAREVVASNLSILDRLFREHEEILNWVRPAGGMTAFPWLVSGENARPFCEAAAAKGVLLVPGDCFGFPSHFRLGFGACAEGYEEAVEILSGTVAAVS
ncbi:MAG: aminotransferase class I/II-fold pyridoxal phosphate-dependent enzyme [Vicinamibacteria bacterium]